MFLYLRSIQSYLKDGVDDHQDRAIIMVTASKLIPDHHLNGHPQLGSGYTDTERADLTMAMQRARPTKITPILYSG